MPAKSEAQRRLLNAKFGHAWVQAHHFDNTGKLPEHVKPKKGGKKMHGKKNHHKEKDMHLKPVHGRDPHASKEFHEMNKKHGMPDGFSTQQAEAEEGPETENEEC